MPTCSSITYIHIITIRNDIIADTSLSKNCKAEVQIGTWSFNKTIHKMSNKEQNYLKLAVFIYYDRKLKFIAFSHKKKRTEGILV